MTVLVSSLGQTRAAGKAHMRDLYEARDAKGYVIGNFLTGTEARRAAGKRGSVEIHENAVELVDFDALVTESNRIGTTVDGDELFEHPTRGRFARRVGERGLRFGGDLADYATTIRQAEAALTATAERFGLSPDEVMAIVDTPVATLKERDRYLPASNTAEPTTDFEPLSIGSAKIASYQGDPAEAYVELLREFDPATLVPTETEQDIKLTATYKRYLEWARSGIEPPPINVTPGKDGKFNTSNRRRALAAQEAGVEAVKGWYSPDNAATGLPLKYGDVARFYEEAHWAHEAATCLP